MTIDEAKNRLLNTAWLGSDEDRDKTEEAVGVIINAIKDREKEYARYWLIDVKSRIKNHRDFEGDRWDKAIDMVIDIIDERIKEL